MPGFAHKLIQRLVGIDNLVDDEDDYILPIDGKVVDVRVSNPVSSGYNVLVGWNENASKDVLIPGDAKSYGIAERGYLTGNKLHINFGNVGAGAKQALVEYWLEGKEIC